MSGRAMWAKAPTGSKTAVDHLILLVQIRSTRVAAPTNKIEDAQETHHSLGPLGSCSYDPPCECESYFEKNSDCFKKPS